MNTDSNRGRTIKERAEEVEMEGKQLWMNALLIALNHSMRLCLPVLTQPQPTLKDTVDFL